MSKRHVNGTAVRALRMLSGISVSALAPRVGVTQGYMSNVELGHKQPTVEFMVRVANELGVPLDAITYVIPECHHGEAAA